MIDQKETTKYTDSEWEMIGNWVKDLLKNEVVRVTFTKKDGTERVMNCTLSEKYLPPVVVNEDKKPKKVNEDVLPVFDVDLKEWRSFTIKSLKKVELEF